MITVSICRWRVSSIIWNTKRWKPDKNKKVSCQFTWTACVGSTALRLKKAWFLLDPRLCSRRSRLQNLLNCFWFPSWNITGPSTILLQGQRGSSCGGFAAMITNKLPIRRVMLAPPVVRKSESPRSYGMRWTPKSLKCPGVFSSLSQWFDKSCGSKKSYFAQTKKHEGISW